MIHRLLVALSIVLLAACGRTEPQYDDALPHIDAVEDGDTLFAPTDFPPVVEPDTGSIGSLSWVDWRVSNGDTLPIPKGLWRAQLAACTSWPNSIGDSNDADGRLVWRDGIICKAAEGSFFDLVSESVPLDTCGEIESWYADQGIDWKRHSDGAYFAYDCEGHPKSYRRHVAISLKSWGSLYAYDGGQWHIVSDMPAAERVLRRMSL
jgi:hypothetical protein